MTRIVDHRDGAVSGGDIFELHIFKARKWRLACLRHPRRPGPRSGNDGRHERARRSGLSRRACALRKSRHRHALGARSAAFFSAPGPTRARNLTLVSRRLLSARDGSAEVRFSNIFCRDVSSLSASRAPPPTIPWIGQHCRLKT
jgi:hypothetical protein